MALVLAIYSV